MKNKLLFTFLMSSIFTFAQSYTVETSTDQYTPLVSSNSLSIIPSDTVPHVFGSDTTFLTYYNKIPIGFDYNLLNGTFDSLRLAQDGYALFQEMNTNKCYISMFDSDLSDTTHGFNSKLNYLTEGTAGNRIMKVQYANFGFVEDHEFDDTVNFQLWLYEECGDFEVRIGPNSINSNVFWNNNLSPFIGIGDYTNHNKTYLSGDPNSPDFIDDQTMNDIPSEGMVYRFSRCSVETEKYGKEENVNIYPNPFSSTLNLKGIKDQTEYSILHIDGRIAKSGIVFNERIVNLDKLSKGSYILRIKSEDGLVVKKVSK
ncbi:T9SS type A sorting domain-containing protein [Brumimicrobium aurantiacum]|nr:T9SS type A sorting domain-containing protein [Brumimicrobium aurantiacum]